MRATSSCHRCRSRAGWRDRQVLSGCRFSDIASATYVNGRSKAASWAGFKGENGQPMIQAVNDSVERTHRLTGMPRSEIVRRGIVKGDPRLQRGRRDRGWSVAEFFVEAGVSGPVPLADRPEGQRLLAALQRGDVVITEKLDCAFRSAADALGTLEQLKDDKVALHMIDLGGDVTGNGISKLVFTILSAVAENERDRIRERVRDTKRHRASQRLYNGGKRPFGFDVVEGKLVPNPNEQGALGLARKLRE